MCCAVCCAPCSAAAVPALRPARTRTARHVWRCCRCACLQRVAYRPARDGAEARQRTARTTALHPRPRSVRELPRDQQQQPRYHEHRSNPLATSYGKTRTTALRHALAFSGSPTGTATTCPAATAPSPTLVSLGVPRPVHHHRVTRLGRCALARPGGRGTGCRRSTRGALSCHR